MTNTIEALETYKMRLDIALKAAKICIFEVDLLQQTYTFFANSEDIFGVSADVILQDIAPYSSLPPKEYQESVAAYFSHPDDNQIINHAFQSIYKGMSISYEARMRAQQATYLWCRIDVTPILKNGVPIKMIGVITNINNLKQKALALEKAVQHDTFTKLYNKPAFLTLVQHELQNNQQQTHALIVIDIDNFKNINDTYGHLVGDEIVLEIAKQLKTTFRKQDIIGRFGGDEFIIFVKDVTDIHWLRKSVQRLLTCHAKPSIACTNSLGIALFPQDAQDLDTLMQHADEALYHAKHKKATFTFYDATMAENMCNKNNK